MSIHDGEMAGHVFISYNRVDRAYVQRLADHLAAAGVLVWYDRAIETGDSFSKLIQERIDGCVAFVPVLTPLSAASVWVQREIGYADEVRKPLLPLMLTDCRKPLQLVDVQHEDVTGGRMPDARYVQRLRALLGTQTFVLPSTDRPGRGRPGPDPTPEARGTAYRVPGRRRRRPILVAGAVALVLAAAATWFLLAGRGPADPGASCPAVTIAAVKAAGRPGALAAVLYIEAPLPGGADANVWICRDSDGTLFYQGHVTDGPMDAAVSDSTLLLGTGITGSVVESGGSYVATNPGRTGTTRYTVSKQSLAIEDSLGRRDYAVRLSVPS
jgi:hypothetical protein